MPKANITTGNSTAKPIKRATSLNEVALLIVNNYLNQSSVPNI